MTDTQLNTATYIESMKQQVLATATASDQVNINASKSMLLIIDLVNDGVSEEGFLKSMLKADISYLQSVESPTVKLVKRAQAAGVVTCFVQPIYDFCYLLPAMREQFESHGIPDVLYKKGAWGTQLVASLPDPDLQLVKSNFSMFSRHSFLFDPSKHPEISEYLSVESGGDHVLQAKGKNTLLDYFGEAAANSAEVSPSDLDQMLKQGVLSLDAYLQAKGIETLIIGGVSTHVCVDAAVTGASERGYKVVVPVDLVGGEDHDKHWSCLSNYAQFKGKLTTSERMVFT